MSPAIKVGVIGTGHLGPQHARVYAEVPGVVLAGVFDPRSETARQIAAKHGTRAFESAEALADACDALSVAAPTKHHFEIARSLLERGKHVLVEKPITDNAAQAEELVRLAQARGLILQVGHVERFNPVLKYLDQVAAEPRFIEAHRLSPHPGRSADIGVVLDLMIHDLDIILHLVKSPLAQVDAVGVPVLSASEDIANARLRFANGCVANITCSRVSAERMRKIRVFTSSSYLSLDYMRQEGQIYRIARPDEDVRESGLLAKLLERAGRRRDGHLAIRRQDHYPRAGADRKRGAVKTRTGLVRGRRARAARAGGQRRTGQTRAGRGPGHHAADSGRTMSAGREAPTLMLIAGEVSGDTHAARFAAKLQRQRPGVKLFGAGGPRMKEAGVELLLDLTEHAVVGLTDVLANYAKFRRFFWQLVGEAERRRPDAVILTDYPGFNLRFARQMKARGIRVFYYISPQVWAWAPWRVVGIARDVDLMMVIFPFEKAFYARHASQLAVEFVGHPLVEELGQRPERLPREADLVALLPGSRAQEVSRILPAMADAARLLRRGRPGLRFELAAASEKIASLARGLVGDLPVEVRVGGAHELMQRATAGMVASGTATLESAM
ncbi:MAG: Gfo/Idh/MocA family oxidoreductase, partial [Verrucomicrobiae bacterium]|nr:Gfo/Idh/MocA family oxidoreductase [Verrucomicrobiae bacterium]